MWVNRHAMNNSLVVFVHGLFGNRWATWKGVPDFLQSQFPTDARLRSYDMYLFEYDTRLLRQPPLTPFVVGELTQFLERVQPQYQTVVLIGHSQGGVLIKLCVLQSLAQGNGEKLTVDRIITLGTPHRGRFILNPLYWIQQIPIAGRWIPFQQIGQLASLSWNIRTLCRDWNDTYVSRDPCETKPKRRHIQSLAVSGAYDRFVTAKSAIGFTVDTPFYLSLAHVALAKVHTRAGDRVADMIADQLRAHRDPKDIRDRIEEILADDAQRSAYFARYAETVAKQVARARPSLASTGGVEIKTGSMLSDFLFEFPGRPLRAVGFEEALRTYVERRLREPT
jgi:pimeloyl-ACP methyl ester carboxylesterase